MFILRKINAFADMPAVQKFMLSAMLTIYCSDAAFWDYILNIAFQETTPWVIGDLIYHAVIYGIMLTVIWRGIK